MKNKSDVFEKLSIFLKEVKNTFDKKVSKGLELIEEKNMIHLVLIIIFNLLVLFMRLLALILHLQME